MFPTEPGGFDREMEYSISKLNTFAVVAAGVATGHKIKPFAGKRWIDFAGPSGTYPSISFSSAYYGTTDGTKTGPKLPPNFYTGKIVVIGATAPVILDIHPTPTDPLMPGPEVQANAIATVLNGFPLSSVPGWVDVLLIVVLGVAVPLASIWVRPADLDRDRGGCSGSCSRSSSSSCSTPAGSCRSCIRSGRWS